MDELVKNFCNEIEDRDLTFSKVAEHIGASKQCMSKFKKEGVIGFRKLLRMSYLLFPTKPHEKMIKWCLRGASIESIKNSFEYAATTRNIELLGKLITQFKKEKGALAEYVAIYSIIYDYMINKISGYNLIDFVKRVGPIKEEPLKILIEIIKCYNYYFQKNFTLMIQTAREAEKTLQLLSERELFIKECYLHRIAEILGPAYLHVNNLKLARHYAFTIITADICPKTVSDASYIVGMSYLAGDERKCVEYLQESYDIAKIINDPSIEKEARLNLDFVKLYLNIELDEDSDVALLNFQNDKVNEINLKSIKEVLLQKGEDDLIQLFEAKESKSIKKLYECFEKFSTQANFFFSSLLAKEIKNSGDNSIMVEKMITFTINLEESVYFEKDFISGFSSFNSDCRRGCA